jgi:hypothetical protein
VLGRREKFARLTVERWKVALDRAAVRLNPVLVAVVIGLLVVNISCYMALQIGRLHLPRPDLRDQILPPPALARTSGLGPP